MSHAPIPRGAVIGIIGNGQFGRMIAHAARDIGYKTWVFGPGGNSPAGQVADREFDADYADLAALVDFVKGSDIITFGARRIPEKCLTSLSPSKPVYPDPDMLLMAQNRLRERNWLRERGFPVADYVWVRSRAEMEDALDFIGAPAVLNRCRPQPQKTTSCRVETADDIDTAWSRIGDDDAILEAHIESRMGLSACCARSLSGETRCFPVCQDTFDGEALIISRTPADVPADVAQKAQALALQIAQSARIVGATTIELALTHENDLLVKGFVPVPHTSGQLSIDAFSSSHFKHHVLAITGRPLPKIEHKGPAMMVSLLGDLWNQRPAPFDALMALPGARLHMYGKPEPRPRREMGHLTVLGEIAPDLLESLHQLALEQTFHPPRPPSPVEIALGRLAQHPFSPFSIVLADGRALLIDEPGALAQLRGLFVHQSKEGSVTRFAPDDIRTIA